jgi:glycosyltransferase involved in cell wall biosynthesis
MLARSPHEIDSSARETSSARRPPACTATLNQRRRMPRMTGVRSVCFVAPRAYAALSGRPDVAHVGGAERQQVLLADELIRRGLSVSFVVLDHGQPDGQEIRGIRLFKCYESGRSPRGFRFLHPRLTGLWGAMSRAGADVYYQRGADSETGVVANWCRRHGRGFIFAISQDVRQMARSTWSSNSLEYFLFRYGLRNAHLVLAQTVQQQSALRDMFGLPSTVVRSGCSLPPVAADSSEEAIRADGLGVVLWAGRFSEEKRPDWVARLARELPGHQFEVVGHSNVDSTYGRNVVRQLQSLPNVRLPGYVAQANMSPLYQRAQLLLCTSESEGFPNVFLEAWSHGRAVLSTVDPGGVVTHFRLGKVVAEYQQMKQILQERQLCPSLWEGAGHRGRQYVREHHSPADVGAALEMVVQQCHELARSKALSKWRSRRRERDIPARRSQQ